MGIFRDMCADSDWHEDQASNLENQVDDLWDLIKGSANGLISFGPSDEDEVMATFNVDGKVFNFVGWPNMRMAMKKWKKKDSTDDFVKWAEVGKNFY